MQYILSPRAKKSTCENVKSCYYGNIYEGSTHARTHARTHAHDDADLVYPVMTFFGIEFLVSKTYLGGKTNRLFPLKRVSKN